MPPMLKRHIGQKRMQHIFGVIPTNVKRELTTVSFVYRVRKINITRHRVVGVVRRCHLWKQKRSSAMYKGERDGDHKQEDAFMAWLDADKNYTSVTAGIFRISDCSRYIFFDHA